MRREIRFGLAHLQRRPLLRFGLWSVPEILPTALIGLALARAVDDGFLAGRPLIGLAWLGSLLPAGLVAALASREALRGLGELVEPMRDDLVRRVVGGALARALSGEPEDGAVARLTRQVELVRDSYAGLLVVTRGFLVAAIGALVGLLSLSPLVALLVLPPFLLGLAGFAACIGLAARRQAASVRADERLAAAATSVFGGARDAFACGASGYARSLVDSPIAAHASAERALAWAGLLRTLCFAVGGWLPVLILLASIGWLGARGLTPGEILGALMYVIAGLQPALSRLMSGVGSSGLRYVVALRRLLDQPSPAAVRPLGTGDRLRAERVSFAYGPHSEPILRDLSLTVTAGDHLAVIGPSGIGKSTLAMVLCGLKAPTSGRVEAGARVLIPQEAYVFTGTLRENLAYLNPAATPASIHAALAAVGAEPLVARLGGLDAPVEPARLSAGGRQLIALARAYLSPAPIAVLDEATSHLDPASEARAEAAFAARGGLIVIAHRLTSALRADRILVLDAQSAALGRHDDLLVRSPLYRQLISSLAPEPSHSGAYIQPRS